MLTGYLEVVSFLKLCYNASMATDDLGVLVALYV